MQIVLLVLSAALMLVIGVGLVLAVAIVLVKLDQNWATPGDPVEPEEPDDDFYHTNEIEHAVATVLLFQEIEEFLREVAENGDPDHQ